jgi:hypothetical protein
VRVELTRLIARLFSGQLPSPFGLPFRSAAVAGIEPAKWRLTGARLYQHRPHRNVVGAVGFEPTLSCSRSRRIPRLSYTPLIKSTQRELNPHFRHGKAAGYRYIMGAFELSKLSKIRSTGRDSNPRCRRPRLFAAVPECGVFALDDQCISVSGIRGTRTLTDLVKSQTCCH